VKKYWELVDQAEGIHMPPNDFGITRTFKFASQELQIHPWNVFPPDVTHDICEGTLPRMASFILTHLAKLYKIPKTKVVTIVNSYQFYDCQFKITSITGGFKIHGDAVQVCIQFNL